VKEVLSYLVAIAGVIVTAIAVSAIIGKQKFRTMQPMLVHSLRTSSQRAEAMCHNNKGTVLEAIGAAITAGALTYSRDPAALAAATRPAYDAACKLIEAHWAAVWKKAKTGGALAGGAAVLAIMTDVASTVQFVIAIACGIAVLLVFLYQQDIGRSIVLGRAQVLPEIDRMFVEGRYAYAQQAGAESA
jgi:hypothetical protein